MDVSFVLGLVSGFVGGVAGSSSVGWCLRLRGCFWVLFVLALLIEVFGVRVVLGGDCSGVLGLGFWFD